MDLRSIMSMIPYTWYKTRKDNNQGKTDELTSHRDIDKSVWERNAQDAFSKWAD